MDEVYGTCGIGWYPEITKQWTEPVANGEILAFCNINLFIRDGENWSKPIPGTGGSTLVASEKSGLYNSDEAYKMAYTDALSVAMKALGVAADVYLGKYDGSKYARQNEPQAIPEIKTPQKPMLSTGQLEKAIARIKAGEIELQNRLQAEFALKPYQEQQIMEAVSEAAGMLINTETILP